MNNNIIISKLNNNDLVFEFEDNRCVNLFPIIDFKLNVGTILIGRINDVKDDLKACFVDVGLKENAYLAFEDMTPDFLLNREYDGRYKQGDEILVRVIRLPIKTKPLALSMFPEIVGKYCIINCSSKGICISSKLNKDDRKLLSSYSEELDLKGFEDKLTVLFRTASINTDKAFLIEKVNSLIDTFVNVIKNCRSRKVFSILYEPSKDYIGRISNQCDFSTPIITDDKNVFDELKKSGNFENVSFYNDEKISLKALYSLEKAFIEATSLKVFLKCGGYLIIEPTEALTVIDVNSGKCNVKASKLLKTVNEEACIEIARQMKLRNLSGIILVDFINQNPEDKNDLIALMRSECKKDSIKTVVVDYTALGLMEITRQKLYPSIYELTDI